jgi:peptide/histidine transporter 3/4
VETKYPPDPDDAALRPSVLKGKVGYIIVTEFCERVAYYGFAASLVLFFQTQLGMTNAEADVQFSIWSAACYITPLIGGYIADAKLNRFRTILVSRINPSVPSLSCCVSSSSAVCTKSDWS